MNNHKQGELTTSLLVEHLKALNPQYYQELDISSVKYGLYVRKSTVAEDRQASSIEDQIKECFDKVVLPEGLSVIKEYKESQSAKIADIREEFNKMLVDLENGVIDGVIAWHPDRLARNMKEAGIIIDLLDKGVIRDLKFPTLRFDNTPAGKMALGIHFVMAKQYSEHLSESVDRGNRRATEDGEFIGKQKHGYTIDQNRRLIPDPKGYPIVREMLKRILAGERQKDVYRWANRQNYHIKAKYNSEPQPFKWNAKNISDLIKDPIYAGVLLYGKTVVDLTKKYDIAPMLTTEEFFRLNNVKDFSSKKLLRTIRPRRDDVMADLMRGRVFCGACNHKMESMIINKKTNNGAKVTYYYMYRCANKECEYKGKSARANLILEEAKKFFNKYLFTTRSNYDHFLDSIGDLTAARRANLRSEINRLSREESNLMNSLEKTKDVMTRNPELGEYFTDRLKGATENIKKARTEIETRKRELDDLKSEKISYEEYLKLFESISVIFEKSPKMADTDAILKIFFSNFLITPTKSGTFKGSEVAYKLNEPYEEFVKNDNFVCGAG